jgi:hypothetical protein
MDFRHRRTGTDVGRGAALADPVGLTPDMMSVTVETPAARSRSCASRTTPHRLEGDWTLTSRPCPNFCIQPMIPAEGVTPVGELEVLAALQDPDTVVIDGRIRPEFEAGTIPGAVSVPYTEAADRLGELGLRGRFRRLDLRGRPAAGRPVLQRPVVRAVAHGGAADDRGGLPGGEHQLLPWRHAELEHAGADGGAGGQRLLVGTGRDPEGHAPVRPRRVGRDDPRLRRDRSCGAVTCPVAAARVRPGARLIW